MLDQFFSSNLETQNTTTTLSIKSVLLCTAASLILGLGIALAYRFRNQSSKSFVVTLALLPAIVQLVIMLVNGNLGTGVAVAGAFSLVRFRSVPGSARDIGSIFLAMAIGLATGMGYIGIALLFTLIISAVSLLYTVSGFGEKKEEEKGLKVTIPESLDYTEIFDDLFQKYTSKWELVQVKTASMGSLYRLEYQIILKNPSKEKEFLDEIRCRNGNLEISCGRVELNREEL